ncbi:Ionotropic receptor 183 [Diabrotica virgifera virgifera]|nr:Ionotropic receptor 183 [Diabrotica virgifera virgifera]
MKLYISIIVPLSILALQSFGEYTQFKETNLFAYNSKKIYYSLQKCNFLNKRTLFYAEQFLNSSIYSHYFEYLFGKLIVKDPCVYIYKMEYFKTTQYMKFFDNIFLFVENLQILSEILLKISKFSVWNTSSKFYIFSNGIRSKRIKAVLLSIWRNKIINFILIASVKNEFKIYNYNGFVDKVTSISLDEISCNNLFPNKIENLYGYPIVAAVQYSPYTQKINNVWAGLEFKIFGLFLSHLNATTIFKETSEYNESIKLLISDQADIAVVRIFQIDYFRDVETSYPLEMSNRIIAVPQPRLLPVYTNMLQMYTASFIITLVVTSLCLLMACLIIDFQNPDYPLLLWGFLLSQGVRYPKNRTLKLLLLLWSFSSFIILAYVQSFLLDRLIQPRRFPKIKTVADLKTSDLKLITHKYYTTSPFLLAFGIGDRLIGVEDYDKLTELMLTRDTSYSYMVSERVIKNATLTLQKITGNKFYTVLDEIVVPGFNSFHLQPHCFFLDEFNKYLLYIKEFRLLPSKKLFDAKKKKSKHVVLNISHFILSFTILGCGLACATIIFILETILKKKLENKIIFG